MTFIPLHTTKGVKILVNPDHVKVLAPGEEDDTTLVFLHIGSRDADNVVYLVKGLPIHIALQLEGVR